MTIGHAGLVKSRYSKPALFLVARHWSGSPTDHRRYRAHGAAVRRALLGVGSDVGGNEFSVGGQPTARVSVGPSCATAAGGAAGLGLVRRSPSGECAAPVVVHEKRYTPYGTVLDVQPGACRRRR